MDKKHWKCLPYALYAEPRCVRVCLFLSLCESVSNDRVGVIAPRRPGLPVSWCCRVFDRTTVAGCPRRGLGCDWGVARLSERAVTYWWLGDLRVLQPRVARSRIGTRAARHSQLQSPLPACTEMRVSSARGNTAGSERLVMWPCVVAGDLARYAVNVECVSTALCRACHPTKRAAVP
jgi:hypothetical protein